MVVIDIRNFHMTVGDGGCYSSCLPASMYSVLISEGVIPEPYYRDNVEILAGRTPGVTEFTFEAEVEGVALSHKNVMLRVCGLMGVADISVNGVAITRTLSGKRDYLLDVKQHLRVGKNILTFSFPASDAQDVFSRDVGILGSVAILTFNKKIIEGVRVGQRHEGGRVTLDIAVDHLGHDDNAQAMATLVSPGGAVSFAALSGGGGSITVNNPNLWWPRGLGLQNVYKLTVNLYSDGVIEDSREINIGLRTVEVMSNEECGLSLSVNGVPFFAFGADYVTEDLIKPRITAERTARLIKNAAAVGYNLIRVSPSVGVPSDAFLDACDRNGILVWQQLPSEGSETEGYGVMVKECVAKMSSHPCTAFISVTDANWSLDGLVGSIPLVKNPDELCSFAEGEERGLAYGFGFESVPNEKSVREFTAPADRNIFSYVMDKHTGGTAAGINIVRFAAEDLLLAEGFSDFAYMSDIASTRQIERTVSRLRMARGKCQGAIISTLNDSRPTVSSSSIDYYGRWKAQHYRTAHVFAPVLLFAGVNGTRVEFWASNERRTPVNARLDFAIRDAKNQVIHNGFISAPLDAMSARLVYSYDFCDLVRGHEREYYLEYSLSEGFYKLSKGTQLFTKPKFFNFAKPKFEFSISGNGHDFSISLKSDCLAAFVELDFAECDAVFEENYFDITDDGVRRIAFRTEEAMSLERLCRELTIRSIYDIGIEEAVLCDEHREELPV